MQNETQTIKGYQTALVFVFILSLMAHFSENVLFFQIAAIVTLVAMVWVWPFVKLSVLWFGLGHYLGLVVSKVVLSAIYFLVITPMGVLFRIAKGDPLNKKKSNKSLFVDRKKEFKPVDVRRPF